MQPKKISARFSCQMFWIVMTDWELEAEVCKLSDWCIWTISLFKMRLRLCWLLGGVGWFSKVIFRLNPLRRLSLIHSYHWCLISETPFSGFHSDLKEHPIDSELNDGWVPCLLLALPPESPRVRHPNEAEQGIEICPLRTAVSKVALSIGS